MAKTRTSLSFDVETEEGFSNSSYIYKLSAENSSTFTSNESLVASDHSLGSM